MKKILIQIIASFMFISCTDNFKKEDLIGRWVLEKIEGDISKIIPTVMKDEEREPTSVYHFQDDNKLTLTTMINPDGMAGYYELKLDSNLLILHLKYDENDDFSNERYEIIELEDNTMEWHLDLGEHGVFVYRFKRK